MYSIVLVAAMTASPEVPQFNGLFANCFTKHHSSCYGCTGCYGSSCYSSCYGSSCQGWGHSWAHKSYSSGCWGCHGCTGYSCHGIPTVSSCYGCGGGSLCIGGCISTYGPPGSSCYGQHHSPYSSCYGYGSYAPFGFFAPVVGYGPAVATEVAVPVADLTTGQAELQVRVPAYAKVYVDDHLTSLTGTERKFNTPNLTPNKDYQYTVKVVSGNNETITKQAVVRGGHRTTLDFNTNSTPEKVSSPVTVNMPANAKLFVDDQPTNTTSGKFRTPELTKGQPYSYQFRAEFERDGKPEVMTQKVVFRAGEAINVDFTTTNTSLTASK
jgi:uncharacterized protein (TIGR03000 family)